VKGARPRELVAAGRERRLGQLRALRDEGIEVIPIESPRYPRALLDLSVPPVVIYLAGKVKQSDAKAIALVGTRTPSEQGWQTAERIARKAVSAGFCVVSGLARGIDTAAHRGALEAGGRTMAILGNGLGSVYPPENETLAADIRRNGALLSELPPGVRVNRKALLARDRLQAAMSLAVIVVQAHTGCGSLTTAGYAKRCKRPLFCLRWEKTPFTIGLQRLRKIGAKEIGEEDVEEILERVMERDPALFGAETVAR